VPDNQLDVLTALYNAYPEATILMNPHTAHMVIEGHHLMSQQTIPGVEIQVEETEEAIVARITVSEGVRVANPIHSCIGVMTPHGSQRIRLRVKLGPGSCAELLAHCMFPNAEQVRHVMEAEVEVGEGAELRHSQGHFHGPYGGREVIPHAIVNIHPDGRYFSDFSLTVGRVGTLRIYYKVQTSDNAVAEVSARVFGHATDDIRIKDELVLAGKHSRRLIKTRVAVEEDARSEVIGITHGNAGGARGHMDCTELVRDRQSGTDRGRRTSPSQSHPRSGGGYGGPETTGNPYGPRTHTGAGRGCHHHGPVALKL